MKVLHKPGDRVYSNAPGYHWKEPATVIRPAQMQYGNDYLWIVETDASVSFVIRETWLRKLDE